MNIEEKMIIRTDVNRLAWRLDEISGITGLSVPFLRKEIKNENLKARKVGRCVIVMDRDLRTYLGAE